MQVCAYSSHPLLFSAWISIQNSWISAKLIDIPTAGSPNFESTSEWVAIFEGQKTAVGPAVSGTNLVYIFHGRHGANSLKERKGVVVNDQLVITVRD